MQHKSSCLPDGSPNLPIKIDFRTFQYLSLDLSPILLANFKIFPFHYTASAAFACISSLSGLISFLVKKAIFVGLYLMYDFWNNVNVSQWIKTENCQGHVTLVLQQLMRWYLVKNYPTVRIPDWSYFCDNLLRVHQTLISTRTHYSFCHFNSFLT